MPFEVEDALVSHEAVTEAAAVASPHDERGNVVKAYVVLAEGYRRRRAHRRAPDIHERRDGTLQVPAPYRVLDGHPKTVSGKTRRIELRECERNRFGK